MKAGQLDKASLVGLSQQPPRFRICSPEEEGVSRAIRHLRCLGRHGGRSRRGDPVVTRYTDPAATTDVIREPTGQLAALRRTGSTHYPITDALGSVIALTDPTGAKTDTCSYDPYGADTGRTGTTENPYRFAGEHRDPTGQYKIGQRYYTPELGRWTQPDPLRRTVNPLNPPEASPYIYTANNPVTYGDPTGASTLLKNWHRIEKVSGVVVAGAASLFLIAYGFSCLTTLVTCGPGLLLIGSGLVGAYGTYQFGRAVPRNW